MNVALIQPPPTGGITGRYLVHEPMNLIGLATAIRLLAETDTQIWDYQVEPFSENDLRKRLLEFQPDLVGITAMTSQINGAGKLAALIKGYLPDAVVIAGGQHPTALPQRTLDEFESFDMVAVGEGEQTFARLAAGDMPEEIPGLVIKGENGYMDTGPVERPEDLDRLPIPDRDLVDRKLYRKGPVVLGVDRANANPITVNLTRGCPYHCDFCSANLVYGHKVRKRSVENVRLELEQCKSRYGIDHVSINDSLFTHDKEYAISVAEVMAGMSLTWDCRARADQMDKDLALSFAKLGCRKVFMGAEAGSQRILDLISKGLTIDQLVNAFAVTKQAGILRGTQFVIGAHPSQTEKEVKESLALARKLDPEYCSFSIIMPLPGTPSYEVFEKAGLFLGKDWDAFNFYGSLPGWRTDNFTPEQLAALQKKCMLRFYLRPGYMAKRFVVEARAGRLGYHIKSAGTLIRFAIFKR